MATKKKQFALTWVCDSLELNPSFFTKRMFGGLAVYVHDKMMMMLTEEKGKKEYRGVKYKFEIWNGILYPTDREHHESLLEKFPQLVQHPVLGKWLYLNMAENEFESIANEIAELISKNDFRFGIYPKEKKRKSKSRTKSNEKKVIKKKSSKKKTKKKKETKKKSKKKSKKKIRKKTNL